MGAASVLIVHPGTHASTGDAGNSDVVGIVHPNVGGVPVASGGGFTRVADVVVSGCPAVQIVLTNAGANALTDLKVYAASSPAGTADATVGGIVPLLSGTGGDFATITTCLLRTTPTPHTAAAGASVAFVIAPQGAHLLSIAAASTGGTKLTVDASA